MKRIIIINKIQIIIRELYVQIKKNFFKVKYLDTNKGAIVSLVSDVSRSSWETLQELLGKPWWACFRILHDYVVSLRTVVQCGEEEVPFHRFTRVFSLLSNSQIYLDLIDTDYSAWFESLLAHIIASTSRTRMQQLSTSR